MGRCAAPTRYRPGYPGDRSGEHWKCPPVRRHACRIYARVLAAAQRQGLVGMQGVPVVAIGIVVAVSRPVSAEAMQGVLVQSETMRANVAPAEASHVFAAKA